jgi:hypothetical protein
MSLRACFDFSAMFRLRCTADPNLLKCAYGGVRRDKKCQGRDENPVVRMQVNRGADFELFKVRHTVPSRYLPKKKPMRGTRVRTSAN